MVAAPVLAPSLPGWDDVDVVPDQLIERLYRASEDAIVELAATLSSQQRASLAVFCYRRSHLHVIGLTIAASCDQLELTRMLGTALGSALFVQARERGLPRERIPTGHRPKVTLAKPAVRAAVPDDAELDHGDAEAS
jgi:hypothetical protein